MTFKFLPCSKHTRSHLHLHLSFYWLMMDQFDSFYDFSLLFFAILSSKTWRPLFFHLSPALLWTSYVSEMAERGPPTPVPAWGILSAPLRTVPGLLRGWPRPDPAFSEPALRPASGLHFFTKCLIWLSPSYLLLQLSTSLTTCLHWERVQNMCLCPPGGPPWCFFPRPPSHDS